MNILIIDDHPLFIEGISQVVKQLAESISISKAMTAKDAITHLESEMDIDLILLDLHMPGIDGLSFLQRYKADDLCIPLVVVSAEEQAGTIRKALDWGAMGFIPKSYSTEEMLSAFRGILDGDIYIPPHIQNLLSRLPARKQNIDFPELSDKSLISKKQHEVLALLAKGYSNHQIATILCRTENTIKTHISALFRILGASNRTECVELARKRNLVGTEDLTPPFQE